MMSEADISVVSPSDMHARQQLDALLFRAGIRCDPNLEYTAAIFDDDGRMLATGSIYMNTLRCIAVDAAHRSEGLLARILTFLIERQAERGYGEVFLYTKPESARFFMGQGFFEIERVPGKLVFMSNRERAFAGYINRLKRNALVPGRAAAVVINANPFTLGHLHLLERACMDNDVVHVFVVSEDISLFSFADRFRLVKEGTAHLYKVMCHSSGSYIISNATFPSYFLHDDAQVTDMHARLDARVFCHIANALGITRRYVGQEPFSQITRIYNDALKDVLPAGGIELITIPRAEINHAAISASNVRELIHEGKLAEVRSMVPWTTYDFISSEAGSETITRIRKAKKIRHE